MTARIDATIATARVETRCLMPDPFRYRIAVAPVIFFMLMLGPLLTSVADAHRLRPAVVTITFNPDRTYVATVELNMEAMLAGIAPEHQDTNDSPNAREYDALRELPPSELGDRIRRSIDRYLAGINVLIDGRPAPATLVSADVPEIGDVERERITRLTLAGEVPDGSSVFAWSYARDFGSSVIRVARAGEDTIQTAFLNAGKTSPGIRHRQTPATEDDARESTASTSDSVLRTFCRRDSTISCSFSASILLSVQWRPLLYQVTAFTIAHTITLGLSLYGIVSLSPGIVEPLIALSIVYVGVENILTPQLKPWRDLRRVRLRLCCTAWDSPACWWKSAFRTTSI